MIRGIVLGSAIGLGLLAASAAPAFAQSTGDLQSQIQSLLAQITQLSQQLQQLRAQAAQQLQNQTGSGEGEMHATTTSPMSGGVGVCRIIERSLAHGSAGDDVHDLQDFLHEKGFLSASSTGFFGALTQQALQKWQGSEGLDGVGVVGPLTRERIRVRCGGMPPPPMASTTPFMPPISGTGPGSGDKGSDGHDGRLPIACTMDAMQCPGGQWVGRSGPDCRFICLVPTPSTSSSGDSGVSNSLGSCQLGGQTVANGTDLAAANGISAALATHIVCANGKWQLSFSYMTDGQSHTSTVPLGLDGVRSALCNGALSTSDIAKKVCPALQSVEQH